jgi:hypothetical protein
LGVTKYQPEGFRLGKGCKMNKIIKKLLWKIAPGAMWEVHRDAHAAGVSDGKSSLMTLIERDLKLHDVSDFEEPGLTLGYRHAVKAIRGELTEVV